MKTKLYLILMLYHAFTFAQNITLQTVATGFSNPVAIENAGDPRLFVVEQGGTIKIINADGSVAATPFLNLASLISSDGERGLLGLAFHPNYSTNGYFFVNYTNPAGNTVIARYTVSAGNTNVANPSSAQVLLTITQPFSNHNGGTLRFGPDGYLYIGMGDGGSGGDPGNRAQNIETLLGKMLRIDVNSGTPYAIPPTNPFAGATAGADEIWAIGLRNPWKFSFNRTTGDLWIADVGQGAVEEINKVSPTAAGLNYGWNCYEGSSIYTAGCAQPTTTYTFPFAEYTHTATGGCSITGGYVYTGTAYPLLANKYIFADYCSNKIGLVSPNGTITYTPAFGGNNFSTFGEDATGELYIAGISSGTVYKITDSTLSNAEYTTENISLYPNPAEGEVFLTTHNLDMPINLIVSDLNGKQVAQEQLLTNNSRIDTSLLSKGVYILTLESATGTRSTHKLVIQ